MAIRMGTKPPCMIKMHFGIWPGMELPPQGLPTFPSVVVKNRPIIGWMDQKKIWTTHAMIKKCGSTTTKGIFSDFLFRFPPKSGFILAVILFLMYFFNMGLSWFFSLGHNGSNWWLVWPVQACLGGINSPLPFSFLLYPSAYLGFLARGRIWHLSAKSSLQHMRQSPGAVWAEGLGWERNKITSNRTVQAWYRWKFRGQMDEKGTQQKWK